MMPMNNKSTIGRSSAASTITAPARRPGAERRGAEHLMALKDVPTLSSTLSLLFEEAELQQCGRQAAIDRLFEYLMIQLLRYVLDSTPSSNGR